MFEQKTRGNTPANPKTLKLQQSSGLKVGERLWLELSQLTSVAGGGQDPASPLPSLSHSAGVFSFPTQILMSQNSYIKGEIFM